MTKLFILITECFSAPLKFYTPGKWPHPSPSCWPWVWGLKLRFPNLPSSWLCFDPNLQPLLCTVGKDSLQDSLPSYNNSISMKVVMKWSISPLFALLNYPNLALPSGAPASWKDQLIFNLFADFWVFLILRNKQYTDKRRSSVIYILWLALHFQLFFPGDQLVYTWILW